MSRAQRVTGWRSMVWGWMLSLYITGFARAQSDLGAAETALIELPTSAKPVTGLPTGHFLTDTIEIGRPFQYALSFWHRSGEDVFFPDTSRSFAPFQVRNVALFPTRTQQAGTADAMSLDSAVYTLVSFETSVSQPLQVPVRMTNGPDSVVLLATPDTVFLRSRLTVVTPMDALSLVSETTVVPLRQQFNYPYLLLALLTLLVMTGVVYGLIQPVNPAAVATL